MRDNLGRFKKGNIPPLKGKHQTEEAKQKLALASKGNHYRAIKPNLEMLEPLAYIIGVIYGDGYFQFRKGSWAIGLHVSELDFAESFRSALVKIGLRPSQIRSSPSDKLIGKKQCYRVEAYSSQFHDFFQDLSFGELKHKLFTKQSLIWAFLRGLYESEGTRSYKKYGITLVVLHNISHDLIHLAKGLLEHLGFSCSIFTREPDDRRKPLFRLNLLGSFQTKKDFLKILNPCIKGTSEFGGDISFY